MENQDLISKYLRLSLLRHFNKDIDLRNEYVYTKNLVSKRPIVATTFSEKISSEPELKMFLSSLINELNNEKCSQDFVQNRLNYLQQSDSGEMKKII